MAHNLYTSGERRADMPTFGSWVQKYLGGAAKMCQGASERDPPLLKPAVVFWRDRRLDTIDASDCRGVLNVMLGTNEAFGNVWLRCSRTSQLFQLAVDEGLLTENPWTGVKLPKPTRARVLTHREEEVLRYAVGPSWGRFITVAVGTGLRPWELLNMRPAHRVDGTLSLTADMTADGNARMIPWRPAVREALDEQTPSDSANRYWPYNESTAAEMVRKATVSLGWQSLTLLDLRRTFGTRSAEAGMPLSQLQAIMGHSSPRITATYYAHLAECS